LEVKLVRVLREGFGVRLGFIELGSALRVGNSLSKLLESSFGIGLIADR
jgi:hypothetical protein